ncbi:MAG: 4-aminobutyrate--2-oxoglutarate transaminase [Clostridia bacterium]|nr:4-aminobutyrate--2-oxoglutarate transaminase [Clostridia bacterium]
MAAGIELRTEIPGPRSREILERQERAVPRALSVLHPVVIARARGALVEDVDGNVFLDLTGGVGVLNVGHARPEVVEAIREQADRFLHTDYTVVPYELYITLAEELTRRVPVEPPVKVAFFNSGAEAVENAVKIAKRATGRHEVIAFEGAFHGRTLGALALTSKPRPYRHGMGPFPPGVHRLPYAYCYRCPLGLEYPGCGLACAEALERGFHTRYSEDEVAAVVIEPVQGEGGFVVPPTEFLRRVAEIARAHGVLLIADEVQTGFGRTGALFASERAGIRPDLMTLAKSIAGGLPLSAVAGRAELMDAPEDGEIGGTYVGNPVALAAAREVLGVLERERLAERAEALGARLGEGLRALAERHRLIGDVRRLGAMVGVELVRDRTSKEPAGREARAVVAAMRRRGVLALTAGIYGNVIRFLNPLVISDEQVEAALAVLDEALGEVEAGA